MGSSNGNDFGQIWSLESHSRCRYRVACYFDMFRMEKGNPFHLLE